MLILNHYCVADFGFVEMINNIGIKCSLTFRLIYRRCSVAPLHILGTWSELDKESKISRSPATTYPTICSVTDIVHINIRKKTG